MRTDVVSQIDEIRCDKDRAKRRLDHGLRFANKGQDAPVVIPVHGVIQHPDSRDRRHRVDQGLNRRPIPAFTEIWHALNERPHEPSVRSKYEAGGLIDHPSGFRLSLHCQSVWLYFVFFTNAL
jgi:hypothetical protein